MGAKLQLRIQRYGWDESAPLYQEGWSEQLLPAHQSLLQYADLQAGQRVLEVACGTGLVTRMIADLIGPTGSLLATDLSGKMVAETQKLAEEFGIKSIKTARMGAENLEVEDEIFDLAICALGLMYVPDPRIALAEMKRAVRKDGKVVATVWGERRNCGWAEVFPIVDARVASEVCPMFFATGAIGAFRRDFEIAGLRDIKEYRQSEILHYDDAEAVVTSVLRSGPVALAIKRFSAPVWEEVRSEFLESVEQYLQADGSYEIVGEFVTMSGIR